MKTPMRSTALMVGAALFATALAGCSMKEDKRTVDVNVTFKDIAQLKTGDPVVFGGTRIGAVNSIKAGDEGQQVVLSLESNKAGIVQSNAAAAIARGEVSEVRISNPAGSGESVADGGTLKPLASPLDEAAYQAGKAFSSVQEALQQAANSFNEFIQSDEWKTTQSDIESSLQDLGKQSQSAVNDIGAGVEQMMRDLEQQSGKTLKDAEKHFGDIEEKLQEYGKDGQKDVINSINRLLESLKSAMEGAQRDLSPNNMSSGSSASGNKSTPI